MKKRLTLAFAALAAFGLVAGFATAASAHPNKTSACTSCHGTASAISLSVTQTSNDGTNAKYQITITGGSGIKGYAVLNGSTNVANAQATSAVVTLPVGKTYTIWAVDNQDGAKSVSVSPVAPAPVPVPVPVPVPTPTPTPTPVPVPDPTPVPVPTPTPTPTPVPVPVPTPTPTPTPVPAPDPTPGSTVMAKVTVKALDSKGHALKHATITLVNTETGQKFSKKANSKGSVVFGNIPVGTYTVIASYHSVRLNTTLIVSDTTANLTMRVRSHDDSNKSGSHDD